MTQVTSPHHQRGIAVVLVVIAMGVAMTAATFGAMRLVSSTQNQGMGLHSSTQAQARAWQGIEIVHRYLLMLAADGELGDFADSLGAGGDINLPIEVEGVENLSARAVRYDAANGLLTAHFTGTSAPDTRAEANATVEAIFQLQTSPGEGGGSRQPATSTVFRGGLSITGGQTQFSSAEGLADIAVEGNVVLESASQAGVSGCATGNINLTGGGIKNNAALYAGGDFTVNSMSPPQQATVWARNISIGNSGNGTYLALKAGAYSTDVYDGTGIKVGSAVVGGTLLAGTTNASIPWTRGTLVPATALKFVVTLTGGSQVLVDLSTATIDDLTGMVTNHSVEALSGEGSLPDTLFFEATEISGGNLGVHTLTVGQLWGHAVSINGWGGSYNEVRSNGNFNVVTGAIGTLTGGGTLRATSGECSSPANCWNIPTFSSPSRIAGSAAIGSYTGTVNLPNLTTLAANTSPGLPGIPFCDTRTDTIDVEDYKSEANYIFEYVAGAPQLTIQNVSLANGTPLDGVYPIASADVRTLGGHAFLACGWSSNHCFRSGTPGSWNLNGVFAFPPGIAWFDGPVTVDGVANNRNLIATIVSAGDVTLTQSGHGELIAPNFSSAALCSGNFRPTNLCTADGELVTWEDGGVTNQGMPIGNSAVISEGRLDIRGWTLRGHVVLGGGMLTGANQAVIYGRLLVGANSPTNTQIQQGGFRIITDTLTGSQLIMPGSVTTGGAGEQTVRVRWSRYL